MDHEHHISQSPVFIGALLVFCFPIGLFLVWSHPQWSPTKKRIWTGAWILLLVVGLIGMSLEKRATNQAIADANQLWNQGQQADAVDRYRGVLEANFDNIAEVDRPVILRRVIEFDAKNGNLEQAQKFAGLAVTKKVALSLENPKAQALLAKIGGADRNEPSQSQAMKQTAPDSSNENSVKTYSVSKGAFSGSVIVELDPVVSKAIELSNLKWNRDRIEFTLKWHSPSGTDRQWRYSVYDSEGTKIESGPVHLPGSEVSLGESIKSNVWCGAKASSAVRVRIHY